MKSVLSTLISLLIGLGLAGCHKEEIMPLSTEINVLALDEFGPPLDSIEIGISGSTGCYFCGTRQDTVFTILSSNREGKAQYRAPIHPKWRVTVKAFARFYYLESYKNREDGRITVGQVNDVVIYMRKR